MRKQLQAGDIRHLNNTAAVWAGKAKTAATHGVHAVNDMQDNGARTALCGLVGRFLVDARLTAMEEEFIEVDVKYRCTACHGVWLSMAAPPTSADTGKQP